MHAHTRKHARTHSPTDTSKLAHTCMHTHACMHTRTHTHTQFTLLVEAYRIHAMTAQTVWPHNREQKGDNLFTCQVVQYKVPFFAPPPPPSPPPHPLYRQSQTNDSILQEGRQVGSPFNLQLKVPHMFSSCASMAHRVCKASTTGSEQDHEE